MADRQLTPRAGGALDPAAGEGGLHPVLAYLASVWTSFGAGKTPAQKRAMLHSWEGALSDIPPALQRAAIDARVRQGQLYPPSSPAELRRWCDEIQRPMNGMDVLFYRTAAEEELLDPDFCRHQIEKYRRAQAAGRNAYAGWD